MVMRSLNEQDHALVSAAIAAAEAGSDGEIVAIASDQSDAYHDVGLHYAALVAFASLALFAAVPGLLMWWHDLFVGWSAEPSLREMLTWALMRHPADVTLPPLLEQLGSPTAQARSQALHTLSKIRDPRAWPGITPELLFDAEDTVARTAWRTAVVLAPPDEKPGLAATLATLLGRGDREARASLSRALADLGPFAGEALHHASETGPLEARVHALATQRLIQDPDEGYDSADYEARRALGA
jgi:hypothetical protein